MKCVYKVWTYGSYQRCSKPAKFVTSGIHGPITLCGIHARMISRQSRKVDPLTPEAARKMQESPTDSGTGGGDERRCSV